jgi:hypothetical protein
VGTTLPCDIEAGQMLTVTGTQYGTVAAVIREVAHDGLGSATLTLLDRAQRRPRLGRRETAEWEISYFFKN